jgi:hypothetical protein
MPLSSSSHILALDTKPRTPEKERPGQIFTGEWDRSYPTFENPPFLASLERLTQSTRKRKSNRDRACLEGSCRSPSVQDVPTSEIKSSRRAFFFSSKCRFSATVVYHFNYWSRSLHAVLGKRGIIEFKKGHTLFRREGRMAGEMGGDLILVQHYHNNCTTIFHIKVSPNIWDPPSCEELLYSCCIGVVNLIFFFY